MERGRAACASWLLAMVGGLALLAGGCGPSGGSGGGGDDDDGGGVDANSVVWPERGGGTTTNLPAVVMTGRVVFRSESGETCCVAVDPELFTGAHQLVLDDLPQGPATVTLAAFSTDFAPAVPDVIATCRTVQQQGVRPCDPLRSAVPVYESAPLPVNIIPGAQVNLGDVDVDALPFVYSFAPAEDEAVAPPIQFLFTIVDAVTNILAESVALEVTFNIEDGNPPVFRPMTKRVPVALAPCTDVGSMPCSPGGESDLAGFKATGVMEFLPPGPVEARITAQNLGDPPHGVDFRYLFSVLPEPTATATTTPRSVIGSSTNGEAARSSADPVGETSAEAGTSIRAGTPGSSGPSARSAGAPRRDGTPPPTPTPVPHGRAATE
ncbi:MAG: hypothetical protein AB7P78_00670 [Candidatus Binatia bacterium]